MQERRLSVCFVVSVFCASVNSAKLFAVLFPVVAELFDVRV